MESNNLGGIVMPADIFIIIGMLTVLFVALQYAAHHDKPIRKLTLTQEEINMATQRTRNQQPTIKGKKFYRRLSRNLGSWWYRAALLREHGHG
jgi:tmRNA-binding protein